MEARLVRIALCAAALLSLGAGYRTQNFIVSAPTPQLAREIGDTAESLRSRLAVEWLGGELPPWRDPCPITAQVSSKLGAGGVTSFSFDRGRPYNWTMSIQGSRERVLDSVLPHEITHTIFATHFGQPLPRWADEGACTTVEHTSEKSRHDGFLVNFLTSDRGIAFNEMFAMKDYPRDIMPLYSQGYSVARYLIAQGGRRKFMNYVGDGLQSSNWPAVTRKHYGYKDLSELQVKWLNWVRRGSPDLSSPESAELLASQTVPAATKLIPGATATAPVELASTPTPPDVPVVDKSFSGDGWYLRRRDESLKQRSASGTSSSWPKVASNGEKEKVEYQSMGRPQPPQRAKQRIIEWSKTPDSAAGPAPLQATPPAPDR